MRMSAPGTFEVRTIEPCDVRDALTPAADWLIALTRPSASTTPLPLPPIVWSLMITPRLGMILAAAISMVFDALAVTPEAVDTLFTQFAISVACILPPAGITSGPSVLPFTDNAPSPTTVAPAALFNGPMVAPSILATDWYPVIL